MERIPYTPKPYQQQACDVLLDTPFCGLFLDMGLGKTVTTLTAIQTLFNRCEIRRVLIIAPVRVARWVWPDELDKWAHLQLSYTVLQGAPGPRLAKTREATDVHIVNYELLPWLVTSLQGYWPYDMVVLDESSKVKNHQSLSFRVLKQVRPYIQRLVLLSGTPMGAGYIDLWTQVWLLDRGERLGVNISSYRNRYFVQNHSGWGYTLRSPQDGDTILQRISDICVSMRSRDLLQLPPLVEHTIELAMPAALQARYKQFARERLMELLDETGVITAANAAVLTGKLLQFCNGAIYTEDRQVAVIHDVKLQALLEVIEATNGKPVLVFYQYQHDMERIRHLLHRYHPVHISEHRFRERWNAGEIRIGLTHPDSAAHGLNLQHGGSDIVFFGSGWSSEKRSQAIRRVYRMGQTNTTTVTTLLMRDTIDMRAFNVVMGREQAQDAMLDAIRILATDNHIPWEQ